MKNNQEIILGGGCFWCTEAVFAGMAGVIETYPGYSGGTTANPTYEQVCSGTTGHAEVMKLVYDEEVLPPHKILQIFFTMHDPTSLNKQGNDTGTQYRSVIYYTSPDQQKIIEDFIAEAAKDYTKPIVTEVKPLDQFYSAEDYHYNYFKNNPEQAYCSFVIAPKVKKIQEKFTLSNNI
ncbi:peptide-methionine (S)-S-oxide reductase MsrA [Candidatus Falkowbacteria bacterium]|uniref:Peptide methionine sulfoxide reductase MsrA n=1 Tax=Candidatus Buchananbacteria bacterium CG10_big_fil_rev_8_21_14_0_10_33_19 TaxID=1974525 RepID=A0A2H0W2V1_9BACT|nr:peptide-methionine (S)-S-oxide reductase MsrA [Candidatus Falkowbacteria bacterium]PIS05692.1 MAG: peptide-methionine (S)-S-oxide reductase [Candidatus Buchananbacteria bacterium CG10_big_fil_rev_8_21_14_0_10_33_19]